MLFILYAVASVIRTHIIRTFYTHLVFLQFNLYIFSVVSIFIAMLCLAYGTMEASLLLHNKLTHILMRLPMEFFDTTPKGRILSRCSTDINVIDYALPMHLKLFMNNLFRVCKINGKTISKFLVI